MLIIIKQTFETRDLHTASRKNFLEWIGAFCVFFYRDGDDEFLCGVSYDKADKIRILD